MSRHPKGPKEKPDIFSYAHHSINKMERAVIYRTVDRDLFDANDVLEWLVPIEQLRHLRAAYPYTQNVRGLPSFDASLEVLGAGFHVKFLTTDMECLPPHDITITRADAFMPTMKAPAIMGAIHEILTVIFTHNVLRRVVTWFDQEHVSPSFARQYWPSLGALLPSGHPFHNTDGTRFKDMGIPYEIRTDIRMAPEIVTKGLFCRPDDHADLEGKPICMVNTEDGQTIPLFTKP